MARTPNINSDLLPEYSQKNRSLGRRPPMLDPVTPVPQSLFSLAPKSSLLPQLTKNISPEFLQKPSEFNFQPMTPLMISKRKLMTEDSPSQAPVSMFSMNKRGHSSTSSVQLDRNFQKSSKFSQFT